MARGQRDDVGRVRARQAFWSGIDRTKLMRMRSVNRDILIRTAALIIAFLFFNAQGARAGDVTLAANAVLNNFLMISGFICL